MLKDICFICFIDKATNRIGIGNIVKWNTQNLDSILAGEFCLFFFNIFHTLSCSSNKSLWPFAERAQQA